MNLFNIDHNVLVQLLVPKSLRGAKTIAFLQALIAPVRSLYITFMTYRSNNLYYLGHNYQVCRMEAVLNDKYDVALRRIRIVDGVYNFPPYLAQPADLDPVYLAQPADLDPVYLPQPEDVTIGADFIVQIPAAITYSLVELRALIDRYRLPGKHNYTIQTI